MDFASWTESGSDFARVRRLAIGYGVGAVAVILVGTFISLTAAGGPMAEPEEEGVHDVELASAPEEPEAEPEPQPSPTPAARPKMPRLSAPTVIPGDKPQEADPTENPANDGLDPFMDGTTSEADDAERTVVEPPKALPPPPAPPKAKPRPEPVKPIRVTENMIQPQCTIPGAAYPDTAKAAGIEGTVIVRFVVTEAGEIKGVKAVRGPEELHAACVAALRAATCTPAMLDGSPVTVFQSRPFRFRLKT